MPRKDGTGPAGGGMGGGGRGGGGNSGGGKGRGRMGGVYAAGPGGNCVCPKCGATSPHAVGVPCIESVCPQCGSKMTRAIDT